MYIAVLVNSKFISSKGPVRNSKTTNPRTTGGIPIKVNIIFLVNLLNLKSEILISIPIKVPIIEAVKVAKIDIVKDRNIIEYISASKDINNLNASTTLS
jgi:hypothetical protein